jgi:hypothetical protein
MALDLYFLFPVFCLLFCAQYAQKVSQNFEFTEKSSIFVQIYFKK